MTNIIFNIILVKTTNQNCLLCHQPEGISMAVPMKNGGMKISKVIFYVVLSGITTGVGAFFGAIIGSISEEIISICLSFAARCHVIHCIRRISTRSQHFISWKNDSYSGI